MLYRLTSSHVLTAECYSVIRLSDHRAFGGGSHALSTLASVPYFLLGVASVGLAWLAERVPFLEGLFSGRSSYRTLPIDEDGACCRAGRYYGGPLDANH
jgi:hypothetical protein